MHRFIQFRTIGRAAGCDLRLEGPGLAEEHARAALRADGGLWLLERDGGLAVNRGGGWQAAARLRLCAGDRIRLGAVELLADDICELFGVGPAEAGAGPAPRSLVPGLAAPRTLSVPAGEMARRRRNPETGQLESMAGYPDE